PTISSAARSARCSADSASSSAGSPSTRVKPSVQAIPSISTRCSTCLLAWSTSPSFSWRRDRAIPPATAPSIAFASTPISAWTERALSLPAKSSPLTARVRWAGAYTRYYGGDFLGAYAGATEALEEARAVADQATEARCLHTLGTAELLGEPEKSREHMTAA